jgi:hypothetical protein
VVEGASHHAKDFERSPNVHSQEYYENKSLCMNLTSKKIIIFIRTHPENDFFDDDEEDPGHSRQHDQSPNLVQITRGADVTVCSDNCQLTSERR